MQNFKMKQELNSLRGDHQTNVFDNLLDSMMHKSDGKAKQKWPGAKPEDSKKPALTPTTSTTSPTDSSSAATASSEPIKEKSPNPKSALMAMLKAKTGGSGGGKSDDKGNETESKTKDDPKDDAKFAKYKLSALREQSVCRMVTM